MSHVQLTYEDRILAIKQQANDLAENVEVNGLTRRDLAIGIELHQRYIEVLEEIQNSYPKFETDIIVKTDDRKIKFQNTDDFANWLAENMT